MSAPRKRRKPEAAEPVGPSDDDAPRPSNGNAVAPSDAILDEEQALAELSALADPSSESAPDEGEAPAQVTADEGTPADQIDRPLLKRALESLIFVSDRIVTAAQLARAIKTRIVVVRELLVELKSDYAPRGIELVEVGNGYQFRSSPACAAFVREFVAQKPVRLTRAQLETLALIAYRQPVTRPEIDEIRGVDSGSAMRVLLERGLIKMLGRKDEAGRPLLYGTSPDFLEFFGLRSLQELPTLREFTELSTESRALFKRKTGEEVAEAEAELAAAEEAERAGDAEAEHVSDEDLAALAAQADSEDAAAQTGVTPSSS